MARTAAFDKLHAQLVTNKMPELALKAAIHALKAAYSNKDAEMATALLNDTPAFMREGFASWFSHYGIVVKRAAITRLYTVGDEAGIVKDVRKQTKTFEEVSGEDVRPVFAEEVKTRKPKADKPKNEDATKRAEEKMAAAIKRLHKDDPDAAAVINDAWAKRSAVQVENAIVIHGALVEVNAEEAAALNDLLAKLRKPSKRQVLKAA